MLAIIFEILDGWIDDQNREARREGLRAIAKCEFRIVGQMARNKKTDCFCGSILHLGRHRFFLISV
jgi:hypothetical protein